MAEPDEGLYFSTSVSFVHPSLTARARFVDLLVLRCLPRSSSHYHHQQPTHTTAKSQAPHLITHTSAMHIIDLDQAYTHLPTLPTHPPTHPPTRCSMTTSTLHRRVRTRPSKSRDTTERQGTAVISTRRPTQRAPEVKWLSSWGRRRGGMRRCDFLVVVQIGATTGTVLALVPLRSPPYDNSH